VTEAQRLEACRRALATSQRAVLELWRRYDEVVRAEERMRHYAIELEQQIADYRQERVA
jgi:hypothetical protein